MMKIGFGLSCCLFFCTTKGYCSLTTRPHNVTIFAYESAEFHCGSNTTIHGTSVLVPVNWEFSGEKDCVFCIGMLTYKYIGRYSVNTSVVGEYTLRVENITLNDNGVYTCIDDAGFGPDQASASLMVQEQSDMFFYVSDLTSRDIPFAHAGKKCVSVVVVVVLIAVIGVVYLV